MLEEISTAIWGKQKINVEKKLNFFLLLYSLTWKTTLTFSRHHASGQDRDFKFDMYLEKFFN